MKLGVWFLLVAFVWCVAVLIKVALVRSRGEPYQFTQWDGGLILRGKTLGSTGTLWFGAFALGLGTFVARQLMSWGLL